MTNPGSPSAEEQLVVHVDDRTALDSRAREHLRVCGAFMHHEPIDAYRQVEAHCVGLHCDAYETNVHVGP